MKALMNWLQLISNKRLGLERYHKVREDDRTEFQRDYDRLIFSAPFRRLQNKTQVFPLPGSVFVHNRLTHSLEVSSVGRSLGNDVSRALMQRHPELSGSHLTEAGAIVSAACLAHDLGNPPFGHSGERAIGTFFSEGKGNWLKDCRALAGGDGLGGREWNDLIRFEGNANAFRLLTHHFKGRREGGFVMTYTTLASIVKYPFPSDQAGKHSKFGFFQSEIPVYLRIAEELGIPRLSDAEDDLRHVRHPFVYLVEAADDICYEIMDIEDAHKLKILGTDETRSLLLDFFDEERREEIQKNMKYIGDTNEQIVYLRSCAIGCLERECAEAFLDKEEEILAGTFGGRLIGHISEKPRKAFEACESRACDKIYKNKDVLDVELAGFSVITTLLELMTEAVCHPEKAYSRLLVDRVPPQYDIAAPRLYDRVMAVLDYISGMTDVYALDLYRKINGMSLPVV